MFALRKNRTPRSLFGLVMEELGAGALSGRLKISPHCFTTSRSCRGEILEDSLERNPTGAVFRATPSRRAMRAESPGVWRRY